MSTKYVILMILILSLLAGFIGSTAIREVPPTEEVSLGLSTPAQSVDISTIKPRTYPSVDGSTSTLPLQVMIACVVLDVECAWMEGDFFSSTSRIAPVNPLMDSEATEAIFELIHSGTHGSYVNLISRDADLILVAREPSQDELSQASFWGRALDIQPIALDAFVFLTHIDNPVDSLTLDQVRAIYTGEITNWAEVGGVDAEIHTYQRNPNSGSQELMEKLVMRGEQMMDSPDMILMSMMGPFSAIRDDPLGIGYSVYFYAEKIFPDEQVKMIAVEGVQPMSITISDGSYPLTTEVFAVLREDVGENAHARRLRDWLLTEEGKVAIEKSGYVVLH
jgi:phosphate transport system substrate-binding protein